MADLKQIPILFYLLLFAISVLTEDLDEAKRLAEIEALEKEKGELYKQINEAIDDSVKHLIESNDTDANLGITLITDLKKQLELFNGTSDADLANVQFEFNNETRRKGRPKLRKPKSDDEDDKDDDDDDDDHKERKRYMAELLNNKKKVDKVFQDDLLEKVDLNKKYRERLENRIKMEYRIEDWLKKKAAEKLKIKKYILNETQKKIKHKREKCPRFGIDKKKKEKKFKGWFPCCRKCCKKSYMGCLK